MSCWSTGFTGVSAKAFESESQKILMAPLVSSDIEIKPGALFGNSDAFVLRRVDLFA